MLERPQGGRGRRERALESAVRRESFFPVSDPCVARARSFSRWRSRSSSWTRIASRDSSSSSSSARPCSGSALPTWPLRRSWSRPSSRDPSGHVAAERGADPLGARNRTHLVARIRSLPAGLGRRRPLRRAPRGCTASSSRTRSSPWRSRCSSGAPRTSRIVIGELRPLVPRRVVPSRWCSSSASTSSTPGLRAGGSPRSSVITISSRSRASRSGSPRRGFSARGDGFPRRSCSRSHWARGRRGSCSPARSQGSWGSRSASSSSRSPRAAGSRPRGGGCSRSPRSSPPSSWECRAVRGEYLVGRGRGSGRGRLLLGARCARLHRAPDLRRQPASSESAGSARRRAEVFEPYLADARARFPDEPESFPGPDYELGVRNLYVQMLADAGVIGLALLLATAFGGLVLCCARPRTPRARGRPGPGSLWRARSSPPPVSGRSWASCPGSRSTPRLASCSASRRQAPRPSRRRPAARRVRL